MLASARKRWNPRGLNVADVMVAGPVWRQVVAGLRVEPMELAAVMQTWAPWCLVLTNYLLVVLMALVGLLMLAAKAGAR
jgi:hypothetical protein